MSICLCLCLYVQIPEVNVGCLLQLLSTLFFFKTGPLTQFGVHSFNKTGWPLSPKDPPVSTQSFSDEITGMHCDTLLFIKDARDQNSGVRVCLVSTLLTEAMSAIPSLGYPYCL